MKQSAAGYLRLSESVHVTSADCTDCVVIVIRAGFFTSKVNTDMTTVCSVTIRQIQKNTLFQLDDSNENRFSFCMVQNRKVDRNDRFYTRVHALFLMYAEPGNSRLLLLYGRRPSACKVKVRSYQASNRHDSYLLAEEGIRALVFKLLLARRHVFK